MSGKEKNKLVKLIKGTDLTIHEFCQAAVKEHGSIYKAAVALGVFPNAVVYHINRANRAPRVYDVPSVGE